MDLSGILDRCKWPLVLSAAHLLYSLSIHSMFLFSLSCWTVTYNVELFVLRSLVWFAPLQDGLGACHSLLSLPLEFPLLAYTITCTIPRRTCRSIYTPPRRFKFFFRRPPRDPRGLPSRTVLLVFDHSCCLFVFLRRSLPSTPTYNLIPFSSYNQSC